MNSLECCKGIVVAVMCIAQSRGHFVILFIYKSNRHQDNTHGITKKKNTFHFYSHSFMKEYFKAPIPVFSTHILGILDSDNQSSF